MTKPVWLCYHGSWRWRPDFHASDSVWWTAVYAMIWSKSAREWQDLNPHASQSQWFCQNCHNVFAVRADFRLDFILPQWFNEKDHLKLSSCLRWGVHGITIGCLKCVFLCVREWVSMSVCVCMCAHLCCCVCVCATVGGLSCHSRLFVQ